MKDLYDRFKDITPEVLTETVRKVNKIKSLHADIVNRINENPEEATQRKKSKKGGCNVVP